MTPRQPTSAHGPCATEQAVRTLLPDCMQHDRHRIQNQLKRLKHKRRRGRADQDPGRNHQQLERILQRVHESVRLRQERGNRLPALHYPGELPISARKDEILAAISAHPVVIVAGETGSGKSTQLPKICLEAGRGIGAMIACTQPRRVAATSLSHRLAEELEVNWGEEVGCKIRFADRTRPHTLIKMMTDGMLLAEIPSDPNLNQYDTIIIDEAHERSRNIDFLLGYLRLLRRRRPDLKIIITSATIDTKAFSKAFDDAPVIEVSGRVFPVEVRYWPHDELLEDAGDFTYIDAAVEAVERVCAESGQGDMLVFMPTEKDIRETQSALVANDAVRTEILPLFARLTAAEQQRVFAPQGRRRIIIATNIAETSLTIPGIRYVIDTGLARISRYNPRTQTQRLPVEAVSQSSAEQRKGRCGRLSGGICIRLYSESDLEARPPFTPPEIQRANLADVILRMLDLRIGDIERFPFVEPPTPQAIHGGFALLEELGALDDGHHLTSLGREMARLPIAPTVSRMILQAREEQALREVLVIAAAISIQDPRERPQDKRDQADEVHARFRDPESDFLTFLKIWDAYHDQLDAVRTQNQMRKFCRSHFLSYNRMREWRDIHGQLELALREIGGFAQSQQPAGFDAVHRALVTGLLSNVAEKKEVNFYQATRNREVMLFPGSGLFQSRIAGGRKAAAARRVAADRTPGWIVAAEMVETSRLFARTCARIDAAWLVQLGGHVCRRSYADPAWEPHSGRVLVRETMVLYGLQILSHKVPYQRVDPQHATEIFIREGLMGDDVLNTPHAFLDHNRRLYHKLATFQTRLRRLRHFDLDEAVYRFYAKRLEAVSSLHDLNRVIVERSSGSGDFLRMGESDILPADDAVDLNAFPDVLTIDGEELALAYAYRPGDESDGITLKMPYRLVGAIRPEVLEWLVPGLLEEKVAQLLRTLPKALRKQLVPIPDSAARIAAALRPTHPSLLESLEAHLCEHHRLHISRGDWKVEELPEHLSMRIEVEGTEGQTVASGRELPQLARRLERHDSPAELEAWDRAAAAWEQTGLTSWSFGDLPERLEVTAVGGIPVFGFPGLAAAEESVQLCLFKSRDEAQISSRAGLVRLGELELVEDLKWLRRELVQLDEFKELSRPLGRPQQLRDQAFEHLKCYLFAREIAQPLTAAAFAAVLEQARERLKGLALAFVDLIEDLLHAYQEIRLHSHPYRGMEADLQRLMPGDFLMQTPYEQLRHLHRYLKAVLVRADRARSGPDKDHRKATAIQPFQAALESCAGEAGVSFEREIEKYRWMVEEFRVSTFAQELGTAYPISAKRLEQQRAKLPLNR